MDVLEQTEERFAFALIAGFNPGVRLTRTQTITGSPP